MLILEPSVQLLADLSNQLRLRHPKGRRYESWVDSQFSWILPLAPSSRGAIGKKLISEYLTKEGFVVVRSPGRGADRLINGVPATIKMSTRWETGQYWFQQFRDQNYEIAICLGLSPSDAHCWALPKRVIWEQRRKGGIPSQHAGTAGKDTAWLHVDPDAPQEWLREWGGKLSEITSVMERLAPGSDAKPHEG